MNRDEPWVVLLLVEGGVASAAKRTHAYLDLYRQKEDHPMRRIHATIALDRCQSCGTTRPNTGTRLVSIDDVAPDLGTTNLWLSLIAVASLGQLVLLLAVGIVAFR